MAQLLLISPPGYPMSTYEHVRDCEEEEEKKIKKKSNSGNFILWPATDLNVAYILVVAAFPLAMLCSYTRYLQLGYLTKIVAPKTRNTVVVCFRQHASAFVAHWAMKALAH